MGNLDFLIFGALTLYSSLAVWITRNLSMSSDGGLFGLLWYASGVSFLVIGATADKIPTLVLCGLLVSTLVLFACGFMAFRSHLKGVPK